MNARTYFMETRPNFLLLSVVLGFLGASIAWYYGAFSFGYAIIATVGLVLAHAAVNVLNDYFDYRSGIDLRTERTPFSGGSGILRAELLTPRQVFLLGIGTLVLATAIGIYFVLISGLALLPLLLVAALCVVLYTPFILKTPWPEWSAGLGLGTLPVLGAFFVQAGEYTFPVVMAAIPSGILVHNLLLLNEFPDVEADRTGNRKTLPITLGGKRAGLIYSALTLAMYGWVVGCVIAGLMPVYTLISLATLPMAVKAIQGALNSDNKAKLIPGMAQNVLVVLLTQVLIGLGYILGRVF